MKTSNDSGPEASAAFLARNKSIVSAAFISPVLNFFRAAAAALSAASCSFLDLFNASCLSLARIVASTTILMSIAWNLMGMFEPSNDRSSALCIMVMSSKTLSASNPPDSIASKRSFRSPKSRIIPFIVASSVTNWVTAFAASWAFSLTSANAAATSSTLAVIGPAPTLISSPTKPSSCSVVSP